MPFKKLNIPVSSLFCLLSIFSFTIHAQMTEKQTTLDDQKSVAITIYNSDLALIKDQRNVVLDKGLNHLAFRGVSAQMRAETSILRSLNNANDLKVIEQNFDYDLLTPKKLLEKYLGRMVRVATINPATGKETIEKAIVLSTQEGVVLKIGDRIETNPAGRFIFDNIPENLRDQPTLVTQLNSSVSGQHELELSYLSGGLSWKADYVAELNAQDNEIDLLGWVTLNNQSGADYNQAKLQLVAGDVHRVKEKMAVRGRATRMQEFAPSADGMQEESLFEYHLYSLNRATSILNKQSKQVSLLSASTVPVSKELVLNGSDYYYSNRNTNLGKKLKVSVLVKFDNNKATGLGIPLPKGIVRVYKKDSSEKAQFIGEDRIDHTPKNETISLKLGDAFDITANKKQTDFTKRKHVLPNRHAFESAYQIELKNAKDQAVTVIVREPIPGDWDMLNESQAHKKVTASLAEWRVEIPAESSKTVDYRVLVEY